MTLVLSSCVDEIATITLNRPESLNAYDLALASQLREAIDGVRHSDAAALVVAGAGRAFCAGGDVRAMAASGDPAGYLDRLTAQVHAALAALRDLPVPVIARVHGAVAGGGLGLVLAADVVVASEEATFTAAYGALGLSPDCGVSALLPLAVGALRARGLLLGSDRWDAARARDWGLVTEVVPAERLDEAVGAVAARASKIGREAAAATKRLLDEPAESHVAQLEREAREICDLAASSANDRILAFAR